jgi:hypothetical protein
MRTLRGWELSAVATRLYPVRLRGARPASVAVVQAQDAQSDCAMIRAEIEVVPLISMRYMHIRMPSTSSPRSADRLRASIPPTPRRGHSARPIEHFANCR